jgi:ferrochelatase
MKKALVLLNMGGARSKDELKVFLQNMFNDKNIITIKNDTLRSMLAYLIVTLRLDKAWENYELIGCTSPLHDLTDRLIKKLEVFFPDYYITSAMRYTSDFAQTAIARIKDKNITDVTLLPLYPQYSTTTTKSSLEDFIEKADDQFTLKTISPFYKNETYNMAICNEIIKVQSKYTDFHLIFSAHGLPQKIVDKGDPYQRQIEEHVEILKEKLSHYATNFKDEKVIIYPIAFIVDNSETAFELNIEYREIAEKLKIKEYKVCSCVNDDEIFCKAIKEMIDGK